MQTKVVGAISANNHTRVAGKKALHQSLDYYSMVEGPSPRSVAFLVRALAGMAFVFVLLCFAVACGKGEEPDPTATTGFETSINKTFTGGACPLVSVL